MQEKEQHLPEKDLGESVTMCWQIFLFTNILVEKPCQLKLILLKLLSFGFTLSLRFITLKQFKMLCGVVQVFF